MDIDDAINAFSNSNVVYSFALSYSLRPQVAAVTAGIAVIFITHQREFRLKRID